MTTKAAARSSRRWLAKHWGMTVFIASQLYLSRGVWGRAAAGNPVAISTVAPLPLVVGWSIWYTVRRMRQSRQNPDGTTGPARSSGKPRGTPGSHGNRA